MNCVCITSKGYADLVPGFQFLWDRYVGLPVHILCTGDKEKWCSDTVLYLQTLIDDVILVVLEDYWVLSPIDQIQFTRLVDEMGKGAQKVDLQGQVRYWPHDEETSGLLIAQPAAQYRTSLQAGIWDRTYLLKKLRNATNPWSFELQDNDYDGARIVGLKTPTLRYANIMYKGNVAGYEVDHISKQDWTDMTNAKVLPQKVIAARRGDL